MRGRIPCSQQWRSSNSGYDRSQRNWPGRWIRGNEAHQTQAFVFDAEGTTRHSREAAQEIAHPGKPSKDEVVERLVVDFLGGDRTPWQPIAAEASMSTVRSCGGSAGPGLWSAVEIRHLPQASAVWPTIGGSIGNSLNS